MSSLLVVAMIGILVIIFQFVNHSGPFSGSESQHQSEKSNLNGKDKVYVKRVEMAIHLLLKKWRGN